MESMQSDFFYEFYNAGQRIVEHLRFSISASSLGFNGDDKEGYSCGFWRLDAPKESFFRVPAELQSGQEVVRVRFAEDIRRRFGMRGIVLIDPKWDPENEDPEKELSEYPVAPTKELGVERAAAIWQLWLKKIVEGHLADCQNAMAAGGAPRAAAGFTKRAFKMLGIADPGEQYFLGLKEAGKAHGAVSEDVKALITQMQAEQRVAQARQDALAGVLIALATGQKVDPELAKALMTPPPSVSTAAGLNVPQPGAVVSNVTTGTIKKPLGEFDPKKAGLDVYDKKTAGKKERAEKAAKALTTP